MKQAGELPPPGWYSNPSGTGYRWWDGNTWTEYVQAAPSQGRSPALNGILIAVGLAAIVGVILIAGGYIDRSSQEGYVLDADAKSMGRIAQVAAESYGAENLGSYTGISPGDLIAYDERLTDVDVTGFPDGYEITTRSETGNRFYITVENGQSDLECEEAGSHGCPESGEW